MLAERVAEIDAGFPRTEPPARLPGLCPRRRRIPRNPFPNLSGAALRFLALVPLALGSSAGGVLAAEDPAGANVPSAKRAAVTPPAVLPWKTGTEHRYVWLQGAEKVGETRFRIREIVEDGRPAYEIETSRTYDHEERSQSATSTTSIRPDGSPLRFSESCHMSAVRTLRAHQSTEITVAGGKALVTYVQNRREETRVRQEIECPDGAYLFASQAVEHWAIFLARLPRDGEDHVLKILYPDFKKVLDVTFEPQEKEALLLGAQRIETTPFRFRSEDGQLRGSVWVDGAGRLVQIEFPASIPGARPLRVVLAPERKPASEE